MVKSMILQMLHRPFRDSAAKCWALSVIGSATKIIANQDNISLVVRGTESALPMSGHFRPQDTPLE